MSLGNSQTEIWWVNSSLSFFLWGEKGCCVVELKYSLKYPSKTLFFAQFHSFCIYSLYPTRYFTFLLKKKKTEPRGMSSPCWLCDLDSLRTDSQHKEVTAPSQRQIRVRALRGAFPSNDNTIVSRLSYHQNEDNTHSRLWNVSWKSSPWSSSALIYNLEVDVTAFRTTRTLFRWQLWALFQTNFIFLSGFS